MQDPCFWQWKQNKKSHPEFSIPKGGASQEKQSFAAGLPFSTAYEQAVFSHVEIQHKWGLLWNAHQNRMAGVGKDYMEADAHLFLL